MEAEVYFGCGMGLIGKKRKGFVVDGLEGFASSGCWSFPSSLMGEVPRMQCVCVCVDRYCMLGDTC